MSRRAILLLTTMLATLVAASGVALAATINCQTHAVCNGTTQNDILIGTDSTDRMYAKAGDDQLYGLGLSDTLFGDEGADQVNGNSSPDALYGGPGNDVSNGGEDRDYYLFEDNNWGKDTIIDPTADNTVSFLRGITANLTINIDADTQFDVIRNVLIPEVTQSPGTSTVDWSGADLGNVIRDVANQSSGNDYVYGNEDGNGISSWRGWDHVYGQGGNDFIDVRDGESADVVDCGAGDDTVIYDLPGRNSSGFLSRGDTVTNCERVLFGF